MSPKWYFLASSSQDNLVIGNSVESNLTLKLNKRFGWKFYHTTQTTVRPAVAQAPNGEILIYGNFLNYGGISGRDKLTRFKTDYSLDTIFCTNIVDSGKFNDTSLGSTSISNIEFDSDDRALVHGFFPNYGGTTGRNHLIRVNSDGTLDTAFCQNAVDGGKFNTTINTVKVQEYEVFLGSNVRYYIVGGNFFNHGGTTDRNRLIRLNSNGTLDTSFCQNAVDGGKFNSNINSIAVQQDGKLIVGGSFTNYRGTNRNYLVRLNADGTLDTAFCQNAVDGAKFNGQINDIRIQTDGKILIAGDFLSYSSVVNRSRLIRLNSNGTLDTSFCQNASDNSKFNNTINSFDISDDGRIFVCGNFTNYSGVTGRDRLICLNSDGTTDSTFCSAASDSSKISSFPSKVKVDRINSKLFVGGIFTNYSSVSGWNYLLCLNLDGTLDTSTSKTLSFPPETSGVTSGSQILSIKANSVNEIFSLNRSTNYNGVVGRNYLIKYKSDGTIDTTFCQNAVDGGKFSTNLASIAVQSDGKILLGGGFTNYGLTTDRNRLIRVNSDGTLDTAFCQNAVDGNKISSGGPSSIEVQSDGKILIGGSFTNYSGVTNRSRLIRLNADGTLDTTFCQNASDSGKFNSTVYATKVQSDGKILVGGVFTNYGGTSGRNSVIRLNSDGTLDTAFCQNAVDSSKFGASGSIFSFLLQSDGKIVVLGGFLNYSSFSTRSRVIRLNSDGTLDTAFCQNAVDGAKFSSNVNSGVILSDGSLILGGLFTNYGGVTGRNYIVRLDTNGNLLNYCSAFDPGTTYAPYNISIGVASCMPAIDILSDGQSVICGTTNGITHYGSVFKLKSDLTLD